MLSAADFGRRHLFRSVASLVRPALIFSACRFPLASFAYQNGPKAAERPPVYDVREAYEIYSDALKLDEGNRKKQPHLSIEEHHLLIASETCSFDYCVRRRESEWPSSFVPAIRDYKHLIKSKWLLLPNLTLDKPYDFLPLEEFAKFDRQSFFDTYPDSRGCVMLSPVGFDEQKTAAVVFIARVYPGDGGGTLFGFKREHDGWSQSDAMSVGCGWALD
jgi:hypothetical protein